MRNKLFLMLVLFTPLSVSAGSLQGIIDGPAHLFGRAQNDTQDNYVVGVKYYLNQQNEKEILLQQGDGLSQRFVQSSVQLGGGVKRWYLFTKRPANSLSGIGVGAYMMTRNNDLDDTVFPLGVAMRVSW